MNQLDESVKAIQARLGDTASEESHEPAPIFIFACCWRSGSTLLQRLCMADRIMWGEPFEQAWLLEHLTSPLKAISMSWPLDNYFYSGQSLESLRASFCANLYPPLSALRAAYRQYFLELFQMPTRSNQAWGVKFVRGSSEQAAFMRWLFPKCKLLFLIRNPYDCLRSLVNWQATGVRVYDRRPDILVTPTRLAETWQRNTLSFQRDHAQLDAKIVRYEQLLARDFTEIEEYLGFKLQTDALASGIAQPGAGSDTPPIHAMTQHAFSAIVEPLAEQLGYATPFPKETSWSRGSKVPNSKVCVLVPVASHIEAGCESGLRSLEEAGYVVRRVRGFSAIDQARNALACGALRDGFEEIFWIDSDIAFQLRDVEQLRSHNLPIACGIYPKKGKRELACHVMPNEKAVLFGAGGDLLEIFYCGAGFLSIQRPVFDNIQRQLNLPLCNEHFGEPIVPYFQPLIKEQEGRRWYLAEDYAFCERARQCGYKIMADTTIRLKHIGSYEYSWEDAGISRERFATFKLNLPDAKS